MKIIFALLFCFAPLAADLPRIAPAALEKGDLIALVFPASYLDKPIEESEEIVARKVRWVQQQGYRTVVYPSRINIYGYLSGTDDERAAALMDAWRNPDVKAIWCFRGGYGTQRILDQLDYEWIKNHPKILVGMSDITALHHAIQEKTGLVTFLGPVVNYFNETESPFDARYAWKEFEQMLVKKRVGNIPLPDKCWVTMVRPGNAKGKLVGGNLTLIAALCGTKWQMNTDGKILVLEDVGEEIYRIDRLLWQLKEAGMLERPAGVILGNWVDCKSLFKNSLTLKEVFAFYFKDAKYPVIYGFPSGHDRHQTTLPLNTMVEIDTAKMKVRTLEASVK